MNRGDLQRLSNARIREAKILFAAGEYSGAYYLSGYAVECALKACFARSVRRYDFPDKGRAGKVFIHKLPDLIKIANLDREVLATIQTSLEFSTNWETVCFWTEESRYSAWTSDDAQRLITAMEHRKNGVLPWLKRHW